MPVWPFMMATAAALTIWGLRHNAWHAPALALCAYVAMRVVMSHVPETFIEVVACALWLFFAALMVYKGAAVPGLFFALSAMTYPVLLVFGYRIEYMGFAPFVAEFFAVCALLSIGGGIYGMANPAGDICGSAARLENP